MFCDLNMESAIVLDRVSKRYYKGNHLSYAWDLLPAVLHRGLRRLGVIKTEDLWALKEISLEVMPGESMGVIGANGSGKTTLLSLIAGVIDPTHGQVALRGKVGALIALGAGFHPELTGRENVFLNGAIMGLRQAEIRKLYDSIVDFAELGPFMDTPIKRYSSGMYARLGFSVAIHTDPEILLIDEVLSVGDWHFQNKSIRRTRELVSDGRTVVFVSHSMPSVQALCKRVVWLDQGRVVVDGQPLDVIRQYVDGMNTRALDTVGTMLWSATRRGTGEVRFTQVKVADEKDRPCDRFSAGQTLRICATYRAMRPIGELMFNFTIQDRTSGVAVTSVNLASEVGAKLEPGEERTIVCEFPYIPLCPGIFSLYLGIWPAVERKALFGMEAYDVWDGAGGDFMIVSDSQESDRGMFVEYHGGLVALPYQIRQDGKVLAANT